MEYRPNNSQINKVVNCCSKSVATTPRSRYCTQKSTVTGSGCLQAIMMRNKSFPRTAHRREYRTVFIDSTP